MYWWFQTHYEQRWGDTLQSKVPEYTDYFFFFFIGMISVTQEVRFFSYIFKEAIGYCKNVIVFPSSFCFHNNWK